MRAPAATSLALRAIAALLLAVAAVGCHTSRQAPSPTPGHAMEWSRVKVPLKVRLTSPQQMSVSGTLTMVRDTSLTLSLRVFGMEVALLAADGDSLLVLDKMHRRYLSASTSEFLARMPFGAGALQNLLLGRAPDIDLKALPLPVELLPHSAAVPLSAINVERADGATVSLTFGAPLPTPCGMMPQSASITIPTAKFTLAATIDYNWDKAEWNSAVTPRAVSAPQGYTRLDPASLPRLLSQ